MDASSINSIYNKAYYDNYGHNGQPYANNFAVASTLSRLAKFLLIRTKPKTHIDVGCALGMLVSAMRDMGVESYGIDGSSYAIENAIVPARRFVKNLSIQDLDPSNIGQRYDLVTCVEVVEHIPAEYEDYAIDVLCALGDTIFFSSTDDDSEPTHCNTHELSYWIDKFVSRGYINTSDVFTQIPHGRIFVKAETYEQLKNLLDAETRGIVQMRDEFKCVVCGKNGIHVHEILPRSAFGKRSMKLCYTEKNRVCLCPEHHSEAHTVEYRKMLLGLMSSKYGYDYEEQEFQKYIGE